MSAAAMAGDVDVPKGFYAGGAISQAQVDSDFGYTLSNGDDEVDGWKVIGGWRPHDNFAIEANYFDFGDQVEGFSVFAVGLFPVSRVDLFAKAGLASVDIAPFDYFDDNSTELAYGAGAQLRFDNLAIRAEYERLDLERLGDLNLISLGATYTFGTTGPAGVDTRVPKGLYLGGAVARTRFDEEGVRLTNIRYDEAGWKVVGGWRLHDNLAIEASYVDSGRIVATKPYLIGRFRTYIADAHGFSAFAVGLIPLSRVDFFAKAGVASIDLKTSRDSSLAFEDTNTTKIAYGGGVQLRLRNVAIRAEYEKFAADPSGLTSQAAEMDFDLISLGVTYTFDLSR
jgi:hypothetical protein